MSALVWTKANRALEWGCVCADDEDDVDESLGWLVCPDDALARWRAQQQALFDGAVIY
jgi:hypothetical protein